MEDETSDIINQMFASNLDEILQKVFLFLDRVSLKDARCVCHQWNQFIKDRLWGSRVARQKLVSRLWNRWRNETNVNMKHLAKCKMSVCSLVCDDEFVYCATFHNFIEIYSLSTGKRVHELYFNDGRGNRAIELDVGESEIAATSNSGNICVWDKINGEILYRDKHICSSSVFVIKVISRGAVLTGGGDGRLTLIMANKDNKWRLVNEFNKYLTEDITHINSDGDWVITVTKSAVYLWTFINNSLELEPRSVEVKVRMLEFSFPFIFVVGGDNWAGLQVWNIDSKEMVRHIDLNGQKFNYIKSNGRFLTISWVYAQGFIFMFDKSELCDPNVSDDNLWRYDRIEPNNGHIFTAINTTSLVISNGRSIAVKNYWDVSK